MSKMKTNSRSAIRFLCVLFCLATKQAFPQLTDTTKREKIESISDSYFICGKQQMNEKQMQKYLLSCNDPEIKKQVKRAKVLKGWQHIGFAAIPCAVFSGTMLYWNQMPPLFKPDPNQFSLTEAAGVSGALIVGFLSTSVFIKCRRSERNSRAIDLYNEKYN